MQPLIILAGPTAVGKTKLSIELAKAVGGEILSADSMQVYRRMDIGSNKITTQQMGGIPHHLIDILEPTEDFNVVIFKKKCQECLRGVYERGKIPILTGGTGFYIQAVLYDIDFTDTKEEAGYRRELKQLAEKEGAPALHEMLRRVDAPSAEAIPANNIKRTIRALEYYHLTGERISEHNEKERARPPAYHFCYFVLNEERKRLYEKIDRRVDEMLAAGLVEEVRRLKEMGCRKGQASMQGLGYKEILDYLDGECTLEEAALRIKQDTRRFAKRQLTWFRRERSVLWIEKEDFQYDEGKILSYMMQCLRDAGILPSGRSAGETAPGPHNPVRKIPDTDLRNPIKNP